MRESRPLGPVDITSPTKASAAVMANFRVGSESQPVFRADHHCCLTGFETALTLLADRLPAGCRSWKVVVNRFAGNSLDLARKGGKGESVAGGRVFVRWVGSGERVVARTAQSPRSTNEWRIGEQGQHW
ncbi:hypothetical protein GCM10025331_21640 [Actinoplanes utahensis]|nr:hypothetical protein Aut01nite_35750 [Actinoplanes utahensis]